MVRVRIGGKALKLSTNLFRMDHGGAPRMHVQPPARKTPRIDPVVEIPALANGRTLSIA